MTPTAMVLFILAILSALIGFKAETAELAIAAQVLFLVLGGAFTVAFATSFRRRRSDRR